MYEEIGFEENVELMNKYIECDDDETLSMFVPMVKIN